MVVEVLPYHLQNIMVHNLIKGIPPPSLDGGQGVNRNFLDDSFLMNLEEKETLDNTMN
jgi:hypothetical protein